MKASSYSIYGIFERNALYHGKETAWIDAQSQEQINFKQVKNQIDCIAGNLQSIGIAKGDRIGVVAQNHLSYFLLYGAAAALGAIVLPVNWRLSADEIAYILQDGAPKVVFTDPKFFEVLSSLQPELSSVSRWFSFSEGQDTFENFSVVQADIAPFQPVDVSGDDGYVIIHTAAVAGHPRGALLSHANLLWANLQFMSLMNIDKQDVHLSLLPYFHVAGLFMAMACFHAGALNINMAKFDADQAVELIEKHEVSVMFDFTPILNSILEAQDKTGRSIESLRAVTGLDTPETIEKYQNKTDGTFYSLYGQTETSCITTLSPYNEKPGAAGRPVPMATVKLLDDHDHEVPPGHVGEITQRGPMVFKGYWNLPEDNAQVFRNDWHHTGDLGRFDENGYLWYAGRKADKELIKPGGENVYPAEVEKVILEHPAVEQTVVFGVPDPKWKEGIKAVCVLNPDETLTAQELIDFVGQRIARYKKPQYVEFTTELPVDRNGNIDRDLVKKYFFNE